MDKSNTTNTDEIILTELPPKAFLRIKTVQRFVGLSKTTIWDWSKAGKFPKPIKLSPTIAVWKASDIHQWLSEHGEV